VKATLRMHSITWHVQKGPPKPHVTIFDPVLSNDFYGATMTIKGSSGIVVVVDLYSASRSASNALIVPLRRKKISFQRRSEAVGSPSRVLEWVWKRVPFHRTGDGESPTTKRAAMVLETVGRSKALAAWDVRCTHVHQVLKWKWTWVFV